MKRERYSEFEQVNGSVANRLMNQVEFLEKVLKAALDVVDGVDCVDLQGITGLPEERCKEIMALLNVDWPKWWND